MNEIITIKQESIGGDTVNTVNARDLHTFLGVGKDFSNWIKKQIERARLVTNRDFISFAQKGEREIGATTRVEYHLTLEAGKHIAMLSGTEKGFEVREYFIECEKVAKRTRPAIALPQTYKEALLHLVHQVEENERLQLQITADRPKVELASAIEASPKSIKIGDFAKVISSQTGFVVGRNNFFGWLRFEKILNRKNMPYQEYVDCGWFEVQESTYENKNTNGPQVCFITLVTGPGQISILNRFKKSSTFQKYLNKCAKANIGILSKPTVSAQ